MEHASHISFIILFVECVVTVFCFFLVPFLKCDNCDGSYYLSFREIKENKRTFTIQHGTLFFFSLVSFFNLLVPFINCMTTVK